MNHATQRIGVPRPRPSPAVVSGVLSVVVGLAAVLSAQHPGRTGTESAATWVGQAARIEAHLKTADVVRFEEIGTGVTRPRRAHLAPAEPVESFVWKPLPPGRRHGHWESYRSEIAAYEVDKLLNMNVVPPAVERSVEGETGAAIMWLESIESVKQAGGKVPSGPIWGKATRRMLMFDNLIGNPDRNAGNILIGRPGELILIDHSRAFLATDTLPQKVERVDEDLWTRMQALTRDDLARVLRPWADGDAIDAMIERRNRLATQVDALVKKKGRPLVIIP
jgi:hypothetical protein